MLNDGTGLIEDEGYLLSGCACFFVFCFFVVLFLFVCLFFVVAVVVDISVV